MDELPSQGGRQVLVGLTTYAGGFENRTILLKALRHFRARNGRRADLVVISDGPILDERIYRYADHVLCRPGPSGLQSGELDSLRLLADFAHSRNYRYVIKSCGDVLMNERDWVCKCIDFLREKRVSLFSTHWFSNDSWIVGTKFFVTETAFLRRVLPERIGGGNLEFAFTHAIERQVALKDAVYLINSTTGEAGEVDNELRAWQWEHSHRLHKFRYLDETAPALERLLHRCFLYPALRLHKELRRALRKIQPQHRARRASPPDMAELPQSCGQNR